MSLRAAVLAHLRSAAAAFGEDLPVAAGPPLAVPAPPPAPPPAAEPPAAEPPAAEPPAADARGEPAADIGAIASLDDLRRVAAACERCKLHQGRNTVVFGEGAPQARLMFVGEAPGAREDELGRPFVGKAGQLLTRIIENAVGLRREEVYIANVNKCRPPGNRDPEPDEVAACLPYLRAQIRLIGPEVLVALGRVAAQNLLGSKESTTRLRGRTLEFEGIPVVVTWHPAYLLRQPSAKRDTWDDIKRVNRLLGLPDVPPSK